MTSGGRRLRLALDTRDGRSENDGEFWIDSFVARTVTADEFAIAGPRCAG